MSWILFDRVRAITRSAGIFQQERIFQDQSALDRIVHGNEFLDLSRRSSLLDQTNLQVNRLERYKDYELMADVSEFSLALDLYADEASLVDPEHKHTLVIKAKSKVVKDELTEFFFQQLLMDNNIRPMVRYLCKFGCAPYEMVPTKDRKGIASLRFMNVYNFTRVETRYGDLIGFYYQDELVAEPIFLHPWQVMHMRLTNFENIYHPYGQSILEGSRKAYKQLRLMEDAALVYRITRAPEKRLFKIPVGQIPAKEIPEYIQQIARQFKNQPFYDQRTGTFNERYSPLIQEDDFFLPVRPDGTSPSIDTLPGAQNLDQIADIEYFKKKMIAPLKIPFKKVGIGEGAGESDEKSLSSSDAQFAKAVQWIQREVSIQLTKAAIVHLALRGFSIDDLKSFTISMSATNAIDELYRMETWSGRTSVMSDLKDLEWFPRDWILAKFTDLSPDEVIELETMATKSNDASAPLSAGGPDFGALGGMGGGPDAGGAPGGPEGGPEGAPGGPEGAAGDDGAPSPDGGPDGEDGTSPEVGDAEAGADSQPPDLDDILAGMQEEINNSNAKMARGKIILENQTKAANNQRLLTERRDRLQRIIDKRESNTGNGLTFLVESDELSGLATSSTTFNNSLDKKLLVETRNEYHMLLCDKNDPEFDKNDDVIS